MPRIALLQLAAFACLFGAGGCSDTGIPERCTVRGKVTLDGKPLPTCTVTFRVNTPAGAFITSATVIDGVYNAERVPAGMALVSVDTKFAETALRLSGPNPKMDKARADMTKAKAGGDFPKLPEGVTTVVPVPEKYGNPDNSGLKVAVEKTGETVYDIELTTKK